MASLTFAFYFTSHYFNIQTPLIVYNLPVFVPTHELLNLIFSLIVEEGG